MIHVASLDDVALRLTVDYSSLRRDSDSTELPAFAKGDAPRPNPKPRGKVFHSRDCFGYAKSADIFGSA